MEGRFSVVRYIPDAARDEPINVGVVLQCGEVFEARVRKDALARAVTSDPQADSDTLTRCQALIEGVIDDRRIVFDPRTMSSIEVPPQDVRFLDVLASEPLGKIVFSTPRYIEVNGSPETGVPEAIGALAQRLVRPLRERSVFAPVESPPRKALKLALDSWIKTGAVHQDQLFMGRSGIPRRADFAFQNGHRYYIQHVQLDQKRESTLFTKAQSHAFELEDARRGEDSDSFVPLAILEFSADRSENLVHQIRSIYGVVGANTFDASTQMDELIDFATARLSEGVR